MNYRPISLLTGFSKLFEIIISVRIIDFFKKHSLLNNFQHGFRAGKSTETAMFDFIDQIHQLLENDYFVCGVLLDLTRAFDCVNNSILLEKLFNYGIRGNVFQLMKSYLSNRKQNVCIKQENTEYFSNTTVMKRGVPQGSVMGPLLFIIYIKIFLIN